jgi:hypothetical protein
MKEVSGNTALEGCIVRFKANRLEREYKVKMLREITHRPRMNLLANMAAKCLDSRLPVIEQWVQDSSNIKEAGEIFKEHKSLAAVFFRHPRDDPFHGSSYLKPMLYVCRAIDNSGLQTETAVECIIIALTRTLRLTVLLSYDRHPPQAHKDRNKIKNEGWH